MSRLYGGGELKVAEYGNILDIWHPTGGRNAIWAEKMHFLVENFQAGVPMCAHTFWWGARPKKGRKGP